MTQRLQITIQPEVRLGLLFIRLLGKVSSTILLFIIWIVFISIGLKKAPQLQNSVSIEPVIIFFAVGAFLVLGVTYIAVMLYYTIQTYKQTEYNFYDSEVEYYEGFFNRQRKIVSYKRISEIEITQSLLQQPFGLSTIKLITNASEGRLRPSGIIIQDVSNSEDIYNSIKGLITSHSPSFG